MGEHADWMKDQEDEERGLFDETRTYSVAEVKMGRPLAILVKILGGGEHWIARSQISPDSPVQNKGDSGKLIISEWLAGRLDDEARGIGKERLQSNRARQTKAALRDNAAEIRARRGYPPTESGS